MTRHGADEGSLISRAAFFRVSSGACTPNHGGRVIARGCHGPRHSRAALARRLRLGRPAWPGVAACPLSRPEKERPCPTAEAWPGRCAASSGRPVRPGPARLDPRFDRTRPGPTRRACDARPRHRLSRCPPSVLPPPSRRREAASRKGRIGWSGHLLAGSGPGGLGIATMDRAPTRGPHHPARARMGRGEQCRNVAE